METHQYFQQLHQQVEEVEQEVLQLVEQVDQVVLVEVDLKEVQLQQVEQETHHQLVLHKEIQEELVLIMLTIIIKVEEEVELLLQELMHLDQHQQDQEEMVPQIVFQDLL
jgi:hypothetical protein